MGHNAFTVSWTIQLLIHLHHPDSAKLSDNILAFQGNANSVSLLFARVKPMAAHHTGDRRVTFILVRSCQDSCRLHGNS